jgi:hypothetical protein
MRAWIRVICYLGLAGLGCFFLAVIAFALLYGYESIAGDFGPVRWHGGGAPGKITVFVHTPQGAPVQGAEVEYANNSGSEPPALTSTNGTVVFLPGENDVLWLKVNGKTVMNKDNIVESDFFSPQVGNRGLTFTVTLPP